MKKVMLKTGLSRLYVKLKTESDSYHTFVEPLMAYEVADDFENQKQHVQVPIGDMELRKELVESNIAYTMETRKKACCPKAGSDVYTFQPFVEVDSDLFEEVGT